MMAVIQTRRPLRSRLSARLHCVYLRWLIKHAEKDRARQELELRHALSHLPRQIDHTKAYIDAMAKRLHKEVQSL